MSHPVPSRDPRPTSREQAAEIVERVLLQSTVQAMRNRGVELLTAAIDAAVAEEREMCAHLCELNWPASTIEERECGAWLAGKIRERNRIPEEASIAAAVRDVETEKRARGGEEQES